MSSARSVIVIDDEPELANLFNAFLIKEGYNVITFIDPVLAFEYFKKTSDKHSLIITDMRMPGLSGIDLAKRIREINSKIVIFLMTAFDISDLKNQPDFKLARIDMLIQKPVRFSYLREIIHNIWET
jgi:DNA-binding NtrC family response regulator